MSSVQAERCGEQRDYRRRCESYLSSLYVMCVADEMLKEMKRYIFSALKAFSVHCSVALLTNENKAVT